jgi:hypothetical protein
MRLIVIPSNRPHKRCLSGKPFEQTLFHVGRAAQRRECQDTAAITSSSIAWQQLASIDVGFTSEVATVSSRDHRDSSSHVIKV